MKCAFIVHPFYSGSLERECIEETCSKSEFSEVYDSEFTEGKWEDFDRCVAEYGKLEIYASLTEMDKRETKENIRNCYDYNIDYEADYQIDYDLDYDLSEDFH